jgi:hypothetical protein
MARYTCNGWCGRDRFDMTGIDHKTTWLCETREKCPMCHDTVPIPLPLTTVEQRELRPEFHAAPLPPRPKHIARLLKGERKNSDFEKKFTRFNKEQQRAVMYNTTADEGYDADDEFCADDDSDEQPPEVDSESDDESVAAADDDNDSYEPLGSGDWIAPHCLMCGCSDTSVLCRKCVGFVHRAYKKLLTT